MNLIKTTLMALILVAFLAGCASAVKVSRVDPTKTPAPGVYYSLPRTTLLIDVPITNTIISTGLFSHIATNYGFKPLAKSFPFSTFTTGPVSIRTASEPDPSNFFHVKIQGNYFEDRSLSLELDEAGLLTSASSEADNRVIDFSVQTIETAASIAGKVLKFGGAIKGVPDMASDYTNRIDEVRQRRFDLLTGRAQPGMSLPTDSLRVAIDELDKMEKALVSEFIGKTTLKVWTARFEVTPIKPCDTNLTLLTMGTNLVFSTPALNTLPAGFVATQNSTQKVTLNIALDLKGTLASMPTNLSPKKAGYFYRYPSPAVLTVLRDDEILTRESTQIAQFGRVLTLPSSTRSKSSKQQIAVFKHTGALKTLSVSSKSWDPNQLNKLGTAASSIIDTQDELLKLERERKILEEKVKIKEAKADLDE